MQRGPLALFGAIVAVGLGPAMWLGAQFGEATLLPDRPPVVRSVTDNEVQTPRGGSGAGDAPIDQTEAIRTEPKANTKPLRATRTTSPSPTPTTPTPSESDDPSVEPSKTTSPPAGPGEDPSDPPTESTTPPSDPPTKGDPEVPPPQPPTTDIESDPTTSEGFAAV